MNEDVKITQSTVFSPEVLHLFSEHDDFMTDFLGDDKIYYNRYNASENIHDVWLARIGGVPVGCAAYREHSPGVGEVKRLFIRRQYRGRGISKLLLAAVEEHARRLGCRALCLGTRITLEPAVTLYRSHGFVVTRQDGLYVEMEKELK